MLPVQLQTQMPYPSGVGCPTKVWREGIYSVQSIKRPQILRVRDYLTRRRVFFRTKVPLGDTFGHFL
jgi:hypothetical protein